MRERIVFDDVRNFYFAEGGSADYWKNESWFLLQVRLRRFSSP